jgi:ATP:corrinoid adenosyltransferase
MARLIPPIDPNDIKVKSERDVAKTLLKQLPNDCVVYHSYPWLRLERGLYNSKNQTLRQGEADFLILWPEKGLLVLEVKGGEIRFEAGSRQWFSKDFYNKIHHIKDPFEQASNNLHMLVNIIDKSLNSRQGLPFTYGYAVCFPDLVYKGGATPPGAEPNIIIDLSDFLTSDGLAKAVSNALRKWNRGTKLKAIEPDLRKKIEQAISPEFNLVPRLSRQLETQEEQLIRLTDEQARMLEFCASNTRVAIEGVAGSGKTLLALAQCRRFADQGKRTLFLCYNKALAQWLRESLPAEYAESIDVYHFHDLAFVACQRAGIPFKPDGSKTFWKEECAELLMQASSALPDLKYDAIVVDEGQDFLEDWWFAIDELNRGGVQGALFVFYDPAQTLFTVKEAIPEVQFGGRLPTNCRNTRAIAETCGGIIGAEIKMHAESPAGVSTQYSVEAQDQKRTRVIAEQLKDLLQNEGLDPSQIAILSPKRKENTCLAEFDAVGRLPISDDFKRWRNNQSILMTTIRAFKGLEADVLILLFDSPAKPQHNNP